MPLPECVKAHLKSESVSAQTFIMTELKGNVQNSNNLGRLMTLKKYDELGSAEARAVDKVLALPK